MFVLSHGVFGSVNCSVCVAEGRDADEEFDDCETDLVDVRRC